MKNILILLLSITILLAKESNSNSLDNLSLEELMDIKIYSATKSYQRIEEIPANIIVLTRKDIETYNYTTLDELLKHIPGLFIIDDTEHFQIGSRGSLGSSFKLMINNNPISPLRVPRAGTSNRNFFATPVEAIDRIEIIKGPQAVTYGSNSMYGSINIITNDFNEKSSISISKGNNNQSKVFARISKPLEDGGFTLNTSFYKTDGINGDLKDSFTKDYFNSRDPNANDSLDNLLKNEYKTIDFSYRYKNLTTDLTYSKTNYGTFIETNYRDGIQVKQTEKALALTYEDELSRDLSYKINFITSQKNYGINNFNVFPIVIYGANNYAVEKRNQLDIHLNYNLNKDTKFLIGATYEKFNEDLEGLFNTFKITRDYKFSTKDIYSKLHYTHNKNFEFNLGARYSKRDNFDIKLKRDNNLADSSYDIRRINSYDEKGKVLPEFSAIYHINPNNHLKLLYGKANQLAYSSIEKYEEIDSTELNYTYISKKIHINTSLFYNKTKNISLFVQNGTTSQPKSINGKLESKGLEFALTYKPNHYFQTSTSFTIQDTKNLSNNSSLDLNPGFSPKVLVKASMSYIDNNTRYSFLIDYISSMQASLVEGSANRYGKDSKSNINLSANINHKFNKNLSLNFHITNILDTDYRIPAGSTLTNFNDRFFTPARSFLFSLNYKF